MPFLKKNITFDIYKQILFMMYRLLFKTFTFVFITLAISFCVACSSPVTKQCVTIPPHPIAEGVSAPFAGFIGNYLIVGGGCNFPDVPAADGGTKVYYDEIFGCRIDGDSLSWKSLGKFPQPVAYGATVETSKGLICIGGMNKKHALTNVYRIELNQQTEKMTVTTLPSLPATIDNASATCIKNTLYVTGGNQSDGEQSVYALTVGEDEAWKKVSNYPGPQRIQPVLLASNEELFLLGGFSVIAPTDSSAKQALISYDYLIYDTKHDCWSLPDSLPRLADGSPRALVGSSGVRIGNHLVIAGGVNYDIFKAAVEGKSDADYLKHPASWYRFSNDVLVYDLTHHSWKEVVSAEGFNKAGGSLLYHDNSLYMVCGEVKPGIRTSEIRRISAEFPEPVPEKKKNR